MEEELHYPPSRLAELLAAAENRPSAAADAPDAPPALVEALRESAFAFFAELPVNMQAEILACLSQPEREDILAGLPARARDRLRHRVSPETIPLL